MTAPSYAKASKGGPPPSYAKASEGGPSPRGGLLGYAMTRPPGGSLGLAQGGGLLGTKLNGDPVEGGLPGAVSRAGANTLRDVTGYADFLLRNVLPGSSEAAALQDAARYYDAASGDVIAGRYGSAFGNYAQSFAQGLGGLLPFGGMVRQVGKIKPQALRELLSSAGPTLKEVGTGLFGPVFETISDWNTAVRTLVKTRTGEVRGLLQHPDVPGPIDVPWGKPGTRKSDGWGLAKMLRFHPEVVAEFPQILFGMRATSISPNRIILDSPNHKAAVSLDWHGASKTWLLSGYQK
jgi:hypothetical protein